MNYENIFKEEIYEKIKNYIDACIFISSASYKNRHYMKIKLFLEKILKISNIEDLLSFLINYQLNDCYNTNYSYYPNGNIKLSDSLGYSLNEFELFDKERLSKNLIEFFYNELIDNLKDNFIKLIKSKLNDKDYFNNFINGFINNNGYINMSYFLNCKEIFFSFCSSKEEINKNNKNHLDYYIEIYSEVPNSIFVNDLNELRDYDKDHICFDRPFDFDQYCYNKIANKSKTSLIYFLRSCIINRNINDFANLFIRKTIDNCKDEEVIKFLFSNLNPSN